MEAALLLLILFMGILAFLFSPYEITFEDKAEEI
jgi:hypothetical protein